MFKEYRFYPGHEILKEGPAKHDTFYLIAEGQVKLECMNNPFRRRDYDEKKIFKDGKVQEQNIFNKGSLGNVSPTFSKTVIGVISHGKWIGDEALLLDGQVQQFYSAVCLSEVKAIGINIEDYNLKFLNDMKNAMVERIYPKLYEFRDKLQAHNHLKREIETMDVKTA